jgi:hypothetical protein
MVKTIIHSKSEDLQISRLNEYSLVADKIKRAGRCPQQGFDKLRSRPNPSSGSTRLSAQISCVVPPFANGSSALTRQGFSDPSPTLSDSLAGDPLSKEEKSAIQALTNLAALSDAMRCQPPSRTMQVVTVRSDGGSREGFLQRSPTRSAPGTTRRELERAQPRPSASLLSPWYL